MDQFSEFKNEESRPADEALHSVQGQIDLQNPPSSSSDLIQGPNSLDSQGSLVDLQVDPMALVEQVLTELLPYIASHGGHVELVRIEDAVVFIKFSGACVQCPLSFYTVTYGIERHIKVKVPWITRVEVIED